MVLHFVQLKKKAESPPPSTTKSASRMLHRLRFDCEFSELFSNGGYFQYNLASIGTNDSPLPLPRTTMS